MDMGFSTTGLTHKNTTSPMMPALSEVEGSAANRGGLFLFLFLLFTTHAFAQTVQTREQFIDAVQRAKPGARIELAPGRYAGGIRFENLRGTKQQPIVITAADPDRPPVIDGGNLDGIKLSGLTGFRVEDCAITDWSTGGSAIDMVGCHDGVITRCTPRDARR